MGSAGPNGTHSEYKSAGPGVVIGRSGASMGRVHYCEQDYWPHNTCLYVTDFLGNNPRFVYYKLAELDLARYNSGSAQPSLNRNYIYGMPLRVPDRPLQDEIVRTVRALDDKIDVNRRINQTLEAMTQAIFKSWFVDFDPVKAKVAAKAEGRDPLRAAMGVISGKTDAELDAMPPELHTQLAATAALFPDEMEDSVLGGTPHGWTVSTVGDVAAISKGLSYSSKDLVDSAQTALVTLKSFERGGGFRMDGFKAFIGAFKSAQVVEPGELIVAYTDVTQAAELIGRPAIVVGVKKYQTLVASLDVGIVRPNQDLVSRQYLYGLFSTDSFRSHTFAHTTGTTVLHLGKNAVPSFKFPRPPIDLVRRYSRLADPVVKMKQYALDQNSALTEICDTLLPRLLSGELQVRSVEVGAAA